MGFAILYSMILLGIIPALSLIFIYRLQKNASDQRSFGGLIAALFCASGLSVWGAGAFSSAVRLNLNWLSSGEQSGYFRVSALLSSQTLIYLAASQALFLLSVFDLFLLEKREEKGSQSLLLKYLGLLAMGMAILSENIALSVLFFETAIFVFYAGSGSRLNGFGRLGDRLVYGAVGLACLLLINFFQPMPPETIIFFAALVYMLAFIFSSHDSVGLRFSLDIALPMIFFSYLIERAMEADSLADSMFPVAYFGAIGGIVFAILGFRSTTRESFSMWTFWALVFYFLFNRFLDGSGSPRDWAIYLTGHLVFSATFVCLFGFGQMSKLLKWFIAFSFIVFLFSGAALRPAVWAGDAPMETWIGTGLRAALSFFLALGLFRNFYEAKTAEKDKSSIGGQWTLAAGLLFYLGSIGFLSVEIHRLGLLDRVVVSVLGGPLAYAVLLFLAGLFLGWLVVRAKSQNLLTAREGISMEDLFPAVLPALEASWKKLSLPRISAWSSRMSGSFDKWGDTFYTWSEGDSSEFGLEKSALGFVRRRSAGIFRLGSQLHSGKVRYYWMWSFIVMILVILLAVSIQ